MASKNISKLTILVGARSDKLRGDLARTNQHVQGFNRNIQQSTPTLGAWTAGIRGAAAGLAALAVSLGAVSIIKLAAQAETAHVAFSTLLGDAGAATKLIGDIREFAATTPLQQSDIIQSSRMLLAFGENAENVLPVLRRLGDVGSLTGNRLQDIAEIYGKARVQQTLFAEDINQLTGRGIPVIQEFAKQLGVGTDEVKKLASQGKLTFAHLEQAMISLTSEGGKFAGGMAKQAETLAGKWSTLKDQVSLLATSIGSALTPAFKDLVALASEAVGAISSIELSTARTVVEWAAFAAAVGVALKIIPKLIAGVTAVVQALKKLSMAQIIANSSTIAGAVATAAALGIGYAAAKKAGREFDKMAASMRESKKAAEDAAKGVDKMKVSTDTAAAGAKTQSAELEKEAEKWKAIGERMSEQLRTPFEVLQDSLAEAREALERGVIDIETFNRAAAAAYESFETSDKAAKKTAETPAAPAAISAGTQAAFDRISEAIAGHEQEQLAKQLADRRDKLLEELKAATDDVAQAVRDNRIQIKEARI